MITLIDHFDSFTYNIVQAYQTLGASIEVVRKDEVCLKKIKNRKPTLLILGPGPGNPSQYPLSKACLTLANEGIPIFGICLGLQIIGEFFGGQIVRAKKAVHGKTSPIFHTNQGAFSQLPQAFQATRYHSLVIDPDTLPPCLTLSAWTQEKEVMGVRHCSLPIEGVQFHPESIASEQGLTLLYNKII